VLNLENIESSEIYLPSYLFDKTHRYLDLLKKKYNKYEDISLYLVRDNVEMDDEKIDIVVIIRFYRNWVQTLVPIVPVDEISSEKKVEFYELILSLNNELADTSFELDKDLGLIMISNETHIDSYVFDVFEEEYNAILNALSEFFKRAKKIIPNIAEIARKGMQKWLNKHSSYISGFSSESLYKLDQTP